MLNIANVLHYMQKKVEMKLKAHPIGLINDKQSVLAEEDAREKYRVLHSTPGNIKLLCAAIFSLVAPEQWHKFVSFLWEMEETIHEEKEDVFVCLRRKLGSSKISKQVLDNSTQPGCLKKMLIDIEKKYMKSLKKVSPVILKCLFSSLRALFLTWDTVKDFVLWFYLYDRIGYLVELKEINGVFVAGLIWFNLVAILFAQCTMGLFIIRRANQIMKIPENVPARFVLYCILLITIPFVPAILLLQISSLATRESTVILHWQEKSESPSQVARTLLALSKEKQFVTDTYAKL